MSEKTLSGMDPAAQHRIVGRLLQKCFASVTSAGVDETIATKACVRFALTKMIEFGDEEMKAAIRDALTEVESSVH